MEPLVLNSRQQEVVAHNEGPLLVIAGPGSGKTRVIIERIARLLADGIPAESILALTFSNKAADEMSERLSERIAGGYGDLWVSTFHSFGSEILRNHWIEAGIDPFFRLLSEGEQVILLTQALQRLPLRHLEIKGTPYRLAGALAKMISRAKDELIGASEYEKFAGELVQRSSFADGASDQDQLGLFVPDAELAVEAAKAKEIASVYAAYEEAKAGLGALDFGDLISLALKLLETEPRVLQKYQANYRYILVDEFQDTNYAQNRLLNCLASAHQNLCVVGDDDQSIYRFRGAALKNILDFQVSYPLAKLVRLELNYRSVPEILTGAQAVVRRNEERIPKNLKTSRSDPDEPRVVLWECETSAQEAAAVGREISHLREERGLLWSDFAVLCRSVQTQGQALTLALRRAGIPALVAGGSGFYARPEIRDVTALLRLAVDPSDNPSVLRAASLPGFGFSLVDRCSLSAWAKEQGFRRLIDGLERAGSAPRLGSRAAAGGRRLFGLIGELHSRAPDMSPAEALEYIFERTGYHAWTFTLPIGERDARLANLEKLRTMASEASGLFLPAFMERMDALIAAEVSEPPAAPIGAGEAVLLSTVHQAKGLEFPVVFVVGLADQKFPMRRRADPLSIPDELLKEELPEEEKGGLHLKEERRLCYVAVTRAKDLLYLSYPKRSSGAAREAKPSPFFSDIAADLRIDPVAPPSVDLEEGHIPAVEMRELAASSLVRVVGETATELLADGSAPDSLSAGDERLQLAIEATLACVAAEISVRVEAKRKTIGQKGLHHLVESLAEGGTGSLRPYLPTNNGGLVLSYSQIDRYRRCPLQYLYSSVFRLPGKSTIELTFGILVHQVLERFHRHYGENGRLSDLMALFESNWRSSFPVEGTAERQLKERAITALERYFDRYLEEKVQPVFFERKFHLKVGPHLVNGRVDRVDQTAEGWALIDYKTGKALAERQVKDDLQLSVYHLGARQAWGLEPELLSYYFVMHDEKRHVSRSEEQLQEAEAIISEVAESILAEKFEPTGDFATCQRCDYRLLCPKLETN